MYCDFPRAVDTYSPELHGPDEADSAESLSAPIEFASRLKPSPCVLGMPAEQRDSEPFSAITCELVIGILEFGAYLGSGFVLPICSLSSTVKRQTSRFVAITRHDGRTTSRIRSN
jgi:hypothetical protein